MYNILIPLKKMMQNKGLSERALAEKAGMSRFSLRRLLNKEANFSINTLTNLINYFDSKVLILTQPSTDVDSSTVAISYRIMRDGFDSWKNHLMDMVDEFRLNLDSCIFVLPPAKESDEKIKALIASTVLNLCDETMMEAPIWAKKSYFLQKPWFISNMESLKAFAILESPLSFRKNNIFVLDNFLKRA